MVTVYFLVKTVHLRSSQQPGIGCRVMDVPSFLALFLFGLGTGLTFIVAVYTDLGCKPTQCYTQTLMKKIEADRNFGCKTSH